MKKVWGLLICAVTILLTTSACNAVKISQDSLPWRSSGEILLEDNFENRKSGWEEVTNIYETKGYSSEGYLISIKTPDAQSWSISGLSFKNTNLSVQTQRITGPADTNFGLICRYVDQDNFYSFLISSDGYYGIVRTLAGKEELLGSPEFVHSEEIQPENGTNQIDVSCIGDQLSLSVNGKLLETVTDSSFSAGDVGMILETRQGGPASVLFNHFKANKP